MVVVVVVVVGGGVVVVVVVVVVGVGVVGDTFEGAALPNLSWYHESNIDMNLAVDVEQKS